MDITWIAIIASICMGLGALSVFIYAVKKDYFRNLEDTKYQMFWSDLEDLVDGKKKDAHREGAGDGDQKARSGNRHRQ